MASKKDYLAIVKVIKDSIYKDDATIIDTYSLVDGLADYFEANNPNFDRDKFYIACYNKKEVSNAGE